MRIGTNHGSLSDRIMSRFGDTPAGMVESAMEFLRIARGEDFHNIILSMKSSNPLVMVQAYRLLIVKMQEEFGEIYPLHLGVTEAGDGEDGRIKSAVGIGTLLEDGIGDTIRVSLTEDPEFEIPVCKDLVKRYSGRHISETVPEFIAESGSDYLPYSPFEYKRRKSFTVNNIGGHQVPVVIGDVSGMNKISPADLEAIGYRYDAVSDKWNISDQAADYIFTGHQIPDFPLPGTLRVILYPDAYEQAKLKFPSESKYYPIFEISGYHQSSCKDQNLNFVMLDCFSDGDGRNDFAGLDEIANDPAVVLCLSSRANNAMQAVRRMFMELLKRGIKNPVVLINDSRWQTPDEHLIHFATETGALLLDGFGDGICLGYAQQALFSDMKSSGRTYLEVKNIFQFTNNTAFSILQAVRTRISKTEYISCPSCGRTLFDLQETTAMIRSVTHHLKGLKIAVMGCIVNGPGEMADADFGYVGSGPGKITLYKGKEVVKKNIDSAIAVQELIQLLKDNDAWVEPVVVG
jgi:(E)-4-hydroxy-3-methylbut-2-enyl-diphosphate synthase